MFPSMLAMLLFIALPIGSIIVQSLFVEHDKVMTTTETCQPLSPCVTETVVDAAATAASRRDQPLGKFNGFGTYIDRNHLAFAELTTIFARNDGPGDILAQVFNLPLYKAMIFTVAYTVVVTPLAMLLGFQIGRAHV